MVQNQLVVHSLRKVGGFYGAGEQKAPGSRMNAAVRGFVARLAPVPIKVGAHYTPRPGACLIGLRGVCFRLQVPGFALRPSTALSRRLSPKGYRL